MIPLKDALTSSVGKKYLMSVSGIALLGFIVTHLLGNLQLYFFDDGVAFNQYAHALHELGMLLYVAEIGLLLVFLLHVAVAFAITLKTQGARKNKYAHSLKSKGNPSYSSLASRNMIITGTVLLVFLVLHIMHMKYGLFDPKDAVGKISVEGEEMLDLYTRVKIAFQNPLIVAGYVGVMVFLGMHLRHGFWSAFQSLGALNWRLEKPMTLLGLVAGVAIAAGFLGIPVFLYIRHLMAGG